MHFKKKVSILMTKIRKNFYNEMSDNFKSWTNLNF